MEFENPLDRIEHEASPINFANYQEFDKIAAANVDSAELLEWMQKNNVRFGDGFVRADVNGDHLLMSTSMNDFGTIKADLETGDTKHMW